MDGITEKACKANIWLGVLAFLHAIMQTLDTEEKGLGHGLLLVSCVSTVLTGFRIIIVNGIIPCCKGWIGEKLSSPEINAVKLFGLTATIVLLLPAELFLRWMIDPAEQLHFSITTILISGFYLFLIRIAGEI